jgi:hypothetical protein
LSLELPNVEKKDQRFLRVPLSLEPAKLERKIPSVLSNPYKKVSTVFDSRDLSENQRMLEIQTDGFGQR